MVDKIQEKLLAAREQCVSEWSDNGEFQSNCRKFTQSCANQAEDGKSEFVLVAENGPQLSLRSYDECLSSAITLGSFAPRKIQVLQVGAADKPKEGGVHAAGDEAYDALALDKGTYKIWYIDENEDLVIVDAIHTNNGNFSTTADSLVGDRIRSVKLGQQSKPIEEKEKGPQELLKKWGLPKLNDINVEKLKVYTDKRQGIIDELKALCAVEVYDPAAIVGKYKELVALAQAVYPHELNGNKSAIVISEAIDGKFASGVLRDIGENGAVLAMSAAVVFAGEGKVGDMDDAFNFVLSNFKGFMDPAAADDWRKLAYSEGIVKLLAGVEGKSTLLVETCVKQLESFLDARMLSGGKGFMFSDKDNLGTDAEPKTIAKIKKQLEEVKAKWCMDKAKEIIADATEGGKSLTDAIREKVKKLPRDIGLKDSTQVANKLAELLDGGQENAVKTRIAALVLDAQAILKKASDSDLMDKSWRDEANLPLDNATEAFVGTMIPVDDASYVGVKQARTAIYEKAINAFVKKILGAKSYPEATATIGMAEDVVREYKDKKGDELVVEKLNNLIQDAARTVHKERAKALIQGAKEDLAQTSKNKDWSLEARRKLREAAATLEKNNISDSSISGEIEQVQKLALSTEFDSEIEAAAKVIDGGASSNSTTLRFDISEEGESMLVKVEGYLNGLVARIKKSGGKDVYNVAIRDLRQKAYLKFVQKHIDAARVYLGEAFHNGKEDKTFNMKMVEQELERAKKFLTFQVEGDNAVDPKAQERALNEINAVLLTTLVREAEYFVQRSKDVAVQVLGDIGFWGDYTKALGIAGKRLMEIKALAAKGSEEERTMSSLLEQLKGALVQGHQNKYDKLKELVEKEIKSSTRDQSKIDTWLQDMDAVIHAKTAIFGDEAQVFSANQIAAKEAELKKYKGE